MTNGDVIREMNDDELADFLASFRNFDVDTAKVFCDTCNASNGWDCNSCVRWWVGLDCKHPQGLKYLEM